MRHTPSTPLPACVRSKRTWPRQIAQSSSSPPNSHSNLGWHACLVADVAPSQPRTVQSPQRRGLRHKGLFNQKVPASLESAKRNGRQAGIRYEIYLQPKWTPPHTDACQRTCISELSIANNPPAWGLKHSPPQRPSTLDTRLQSAPTTTCSALPWLCPPL